MPGVYHNIEIQAIKPGTNIGMFKKPTLVSQSKVEPCYNEVLGIMKITLL